MRDQRHTPAALPPKKTRYPFCRRLGLDGWGNSRHPLEFGPRTVQPVASRYTDWVIPAQFTYVLMYYVHMRVFTDTEYIYIHEHNMQALAQGDSIFAIELHRGKKNLKN